MIPFQEGFIETYERLAKIPQEVFPVSSEYVEKEGVGDQVLAGRTNFLPPPLWKSKLVVYKERQTFTFPPNVKVLLQHLDKEVK